MPKKPAKEKPLLHLIRGSGDPGLYSEELSWYVGCFESLAGLSTVSGLNPSPEQQVGIGPHIVTESNHYDDRHVTFGRPDGAFTKARRIWNALVRLPYNTQVFLLGIYEPRQYWPPERKLPPEAQVRAAHLAFYEAKKSLRESEKL